MIGACSSDTQVTPNALTASGTAPATSTVSSPSPLSIKGAPATSVEAGQAYNFDPTAGGGAGNALTFTITGQPPWATFNSATGALAGTPTAAEVGTYANIVITVSAGNATASLAAFTIKVTETATGSATLTWAAPALNTDGTAITNLAGFRIYYGTSEGALTQVITVPSATTTTYAIEQLDTGTYYFAVAAYNTDGVESGQSNIGSKTI
jgi:hypothetical protein